MMWNVFTTRLTSKNQLTAPAKLCRALGWKPGDLLRVRVVDEDSFQVARQKRREASSL